MHYAVGRRILGGMNKMKFVLLGMVTAMVVITMTEITIGQERRSQNGSNAFSYGIYQHNLSI